VVSLFSRRFIEWVVLGFAAYAFCFMPLGKRTGLEHVRAILATDAAQDAQEELKEAGGKLVTEILKDKNTPRPIRGEPKVPELAPANLRVAPNEATQADAGL